jgi:outer membrane biosynthesis protein TonB
MRILAAALGALLISTSQPALALGGHEQDELQQTEAQQTEPQQAEPQKAEAPAAEMQPAEAPQPVIQQAETQPAEAPQPDMQQAEAQPAEAPQPAMQQAEAQPAEAPQPAMQQAETQPAEAPQPDMQQAEMQQAEVSQGVAPPAEPQQPNTRQEMRQAAAPQVEAPQGALAAVPQAGLPRDAKWTVFVETKYGTRLDVPSAVFATPDGPANRGVGRQFKTPDGRASLAVYSQRNDARDTPASYLRKNLQSARAGLDYERLTPEFFAIAAVMRGSIYYSRCNFSHDAGRAIHCFDLKYPVQERQSWDGIVTRMSRSLRPLHGG